MTSLIAVHKATQKQNIYIILEQYCNETPTWKNKWMEIKHWNFVSNETWTQCIRVESNLEAGQGPTVSQMPKI